MPACKRAADLGTVPRKPTHFHQADPKPPIANDRFWVVN